MMALEDIANLRRWVISGTIVVLAHGAFAAAMVTWRDTDEAAEPAAAIVVEFAPVPVGPAKPESDLAPGPEQVMSDASPNRPTETLEEKIEEKVELKVEVKVEQKVEEKVEPKPVEEPPPEVQAGAQSGGGDRAAGAAAGGQAGNAAAAGAAAAGARSPRRRRWCRRRRRRSRLLRRQVRSPPRTLRAS